MPLLSQVLDSPCESVFALPGWFAGLLVPIQTWVHSKKASVWQGSGKYGNNMGPLILFPHISYNMLLEHVPVF